MLLKGRFNCNLCNYKTNFKKEIDSHHIQPKELNGSDAKENRINLCPNCHRKIYEPSSTKGIHSIKTSNSIQLISKRFSTNGWLLEYIDENNETQFKKLLN